MDRKERNDFIKTNIAKIIVAFVLSFLFGIFIILAFKNLFHITLHNNKTTATTTVTTVSEVETTTTITTSKITTTPTETTTKATTNPITTTTKKIITTTKITTVKPKVTKSTKKVTEVTTSKSIKKNTTVKKDEKVYLGEFEATAYYCGNWSRGITANGSTPKANHTIAADPKYPFGTKLLINGIVYTVEDRGGAIHDNVLDIYFNTYDECVNFGRKTVKVYLIK